MLTEAVSDFASRTAEKLRAQNSFASQILVFAHTSPFRKVPQYSGHKVIRLIRPTADTPFLVKASCEGMSQIYRSGFEFFKAGVMLLDVTPETTHQGELDLEEQDLSSRPTLMTAVDALNARFGRETICIASAGSTGERQAWKMRQERLSPHYRTRWSDLPVARAN